MSLKRKESTMFQDKHRTRLQGILCDFDDDISDVAKLASFDDILSKDLQSEEVIEDELC